MKKVTKVLTLFTVGLLLMFVLTGCGSEEPAATSQDEQGAATEETVYEMRLVHQHPETTQHGKNALKFKEVVEKHTNGRVKVILYPAAQLGGAEKEPQMVLSGAVEATITYNGTINHMIPEEMIYDIPFLFDVEPGDGTIIQAVQKNELINNAISARCEEVGFKTLGNVPTCYGVFVAANNVRPINTPWDAKGLKIRLPASVMTKVIFDSMGASPVSIVAAEVPVGLSQGVFDGLVTTLAYYHDARWHTKYLTTNFATGGSYPIYINLKWWNALPKELQDAIENKAMPELLEYAYDAVNTGEAAVVEEMQKEPFNVEVTRWDTSDPAIQQWIQEVQQKGIEVFIEHVGEKGQAMVDEVLKIRKEAGL